MIEKRNFATKLELSIETLDYFAQYPELKRICAKCYDKGVLTKKSPEKASKLYLESAYLDNKAQVQFNHNSNYYDLGKLLKAEEFNLYFQGVDTFKDTQCFLELIGFNKEEGSLLGIKLDEETLDYYAKQPSLKVICAQCYENGVLIKENPIKAFNLYLESSKLFEKSNIKSLVLFHVSYYVKIAEMYAEGRGTKQDYDAAITYYQKYLSYFKKDEKPTKNNLLLKTYKKLSYIYQEVKKDYFLASYYESKAKGFNDADAYFTAAYREYVNIIDNNAKNYDEVKKHLQLAYEKGATEAATLIKKLDELKNK